MKTSPSEFNNFNALLTSNAPKGYTPWYFPVSAGGKDPDGIEISKRAPTKYVGKRGSWKAEHAKLTYEEAMQRLTKGGNVGIAGTSTDKLVICDIDNEKYVKQLPSSLIITSRKRYGKHGFYWAEDKESKQNITTDDGELRSDFEYVVAAGSYSEVTDEELKKVVEAGKVSAKTVEEVKKDEKLGVYTVEIAMPPAKITYAELPQIYRNADAKRQQSPIKGREETSKNRFINNKPLDLTGASALFKLTLANVLPKYEQDERLPHPLHESETGKNFSVSQDGNLGHCWRHLVSLNAIQFLCVKTKYATCNEAGTPHGGKYSSQLKRDKGSIFHAWQQAKHDGLIPEDDKIPTAAIWYVAFAAEIVEKDYEPQDWSIIPAKIYQQTISYIEEVM